MSRNTSKKPNSTNKGNSLLVGLLLGLIAGLGLAAGLAWYLVKSPSPFVSKEAAVINKPQAAEQLRATASTVVKANASPVVAVSAVSPVSGVVEDKPRFEFYKVLTDKQDATALPNTGTTSPAKAADPTKAKPESSKTSTEINPKMPVAKQTYYLQAGAFANQEEAEKLKANLIFEGMEVTILTVNSPDKGTLHKVRLGPYQSTDEMNGIRAKLQLKGISSNPMHGQ
jgi:cell division protein FtsN